MQSRLESIDFFKLKTLVVLAFLISAPIAYFVTRQWLQNFAYRIEIGFETFLIAGLLALVIAWFTVLFHAMRAALANPVESLRYE